LAHPDDESFGPGGTLAKYAAEGVVVHYLCGTRGETGTVDAALLNGHADIAALRTAELNCAAQALGLKGVHFLGYRDSGMPGAPDNHFENALFAAPLDEVAARVISFFDLLKPDIVLTHDQFGGYGHPDHIKLHQATLRAYELRYGVRIDVTNWRGSAERPSVSVLPAQPGLAPALYFAIFPKNTLRMGVRLLPLVGRNPRQFGRNKDIDLTQVASWDVPATTLIKTGMHAKTKERASACHVSQQPPSQAPFFVRLLFRMGRGKEHFSRVYPPAQACVSEQGFLGL
jgi:LmbE family N-acetylglucosaminyl deacetylase